MFINLLVFMSDWDWERKKLSRWMLRFGVSEVCVQQGCGGALSAKLCLWIPQSYGLGLPAAAPEGMETETAARVALPWNVGCPTTVTSALRVKFLLLVWDLQEANCSLRRHAVSLDLTFPLAVSFFPPSIFVRMWGNVSVYIWVRIPPMDSIRLFSLCPCAPLLHIFLQRRNNLSQAFPAGNGLIS